MLARPFGKGRVVILGTSALERVGHALAMNKLLQHPVKLNLSYEYFRLGSNVLVLPAPGANDGEVQIPKTWLGEEPPRPQRDFSTMDLQSGDFEPAVPVKVTQNDIIFKLPPGRLLLLLNR